MNNILCLYVAMMCVIYLLGVEIINVLSFTDDWYEYRQTSTVISE